jgi:Bacterial conjugation TrbI-like protein
VADLVAIFCVSDSVAIRACVAGLDGVAGLGDRALALNARTMLARELTVKLLDHWHEIWVKPSNRNSCFAQTQLARPKYCVVWIKNADEVGQELTRRNLDVQPTLTIRPGFPVRVVVNADIVLRPYQPLFFDRSSP